MTTNLEHKFDLYKQNSPVPLVEVKMTVEYEPLTDKATAKSFSIYCPLNKTKLDLSSIMNKDIFKYIIANEIAITDWKTLHMHELYHQQNANDRINDNVSHDIGTGSTLTYLESKPVIGSL